MPSTPLELSPTTDALLASPTGDLRLTAATHRDEPLGRPCHIARLPIELVSHIFQLLIDTVGFNDKQHSTVTQIQIALVCTCAHWRDIALSTPRLWSSITWLYRRPARSLRQFEKRLAGLDIMLARSLPSSPTSRQEKSCTWIGTTATETTAKDRSPLIINGGDGIPLDGYLDLEPARDNEQLKIWILLVPHLQRFRSLHIRASIHSSVGNIFYLPGPLTRLRDFSVVYSARRVGWGPYAYQEEDEVQGGSEPELVSTVRVSSTISSRTVPPPPPPTPLVSRRRGNGNGSTLPFAGNTNAVRDPGIHTLGLLTPYNTAPLERFTYIHPGGSSSALPARAFDNLLRGGTVSTLTSLQLGVSFDENSWGAIVRFIVACPNLMELDLTMMEPSSPSPGEMMMYNEALLEEEVEFEFGPGDDDRASDRATLPTLKSLSLSDIGPHHLFRHLATPQLEELVLRSSSSSSQHNMIIDPDSGLPLASSSLSWLSTPAPSPLSTAERALAQISPVLKSLTIQVLNLKPAAVPVGYHDVRPPLAAHYPEDPWLTQALDPHPHTQRIKTNMDVLLEENGSLQCLRMIGGWMEGVQVVRSLLPGHQSTASDHDQGASVSAHVQSTDSEVRRPSLLPLLSELHIQDYPRASFSSRHLIDLVNARRGLAITMDRYALDSETDDDIHDMAIDPRFWSDCASDWEPRTRRCHGVLRDLSGAVVFQS